MSITTVYLSFELKCVSHDQSMYVRYVKNFCNKKPGELEIHLGYGHMAVLIIATTPGKFRANSRDK